MVRSPSCDLWIWGLSHRSGLYQCLSFAGEGRGKPDSEWQSQQQTLEGRHQLRAEQQHPPEVPGGFPPPQHSSGDTHPSGTQQLTPHPRDYPPGESFREVGLHLDLWPSMEPFVVNVGGFYVCDTVVETRPNKRFCLVILLCSPGYPPTNDVLHHREERRADTAD